MKTSWSDVEAALHSFEPNDIVLWRGLPVDFVSWAPDEAEFILWAGGTEKNCGMTVNDILVECRGMITDINWPEIVPLPMAVMPMGRSYEELNIHDLSGE